MIEGAHIIPDEYRQKISEASTKEERHELFLEARREIYVTAVQLRERITEFGRNLDQAQTAESLKLTQQQAEILAHACDVLNQDAQKCTQFWEQQPVTENGTQLSDDWIVGFLGKSPSGTITGTNNDTLGCIELTASNVYDINSQTLTERFSEPDQKEIDNLSLWGDQYPATLDRYGVTHGFYRPGSGEIPFPVIVAGPLNREAVLAHERSHHVSNAIDYALYQVQPGSGIVTVGEREKARNGFYYRAEFFQYGTTPKFIEELTIILDTLKKGYLESARGEVAADYDTNSGISIIRNLLPGGQYDYFVNEFNKEIGAYPANVQQLIKQARENYYDVLLQNLTPVHEAFEQAQAASDATKIQQIMGMVHTTQINLWARKLLQFMQEKGASSAA